MDSIPVPGGRSALLLMSINLVAKLIFRSRWQLKSLGVNIAHIGTFLLMFGAFLTAYFSTEGSLYIREGDSARYYVDNEQYALAVKDTSDQRFDSVYEFSGPYLQAGAEIQHEKLPGSIRVINFYDNAELEMSPNKSPGAWRGLAERHVLVPKAPDKTMENNRRAMVIELTGCGPLSDGKYIVAQTNGPATSFMAAGKRYTLSIGPRLRPLPNNMRFELNDFVAEYYPGTTKPKHYASHLTLYEDGTKRQALIQMNEPLRLHGHTFYQSSFEKGNGEEATILSVVENYGRLFPYISSIVICIGIGLHLLLHYPAFLKRFVEQTTRQASLILLILGSLCVFAPAAAAEDAFVEHVDDLVVQHHGRIKPYDTFARATLLGIYQKQRFSGKDAADWLWTAMTNQQIALNAEVFTIRNHAVVEAIGVQAQPSNRYKMVDLLKGLTEHEALIQALAKRAEAQEQALDETEAQLLDLYRMSSNYLPLVHSLSCFWPDITIADAETAAAFGVEAGSQVSYYFLITKRVELRQVLLHAAKQKEQDPNYDDAAVADLLRQFTRRVEDEAATNFPIIPATAEQAVLKWKSPWDVLDGGGISEQEQELMGHLDQAVKSFVQSDQAGFVASMTAFKDAVGHRAKINLEVSYNKADLFYKSLYFYIGAFLLLMVFWLTKQRRLYQASMLLLIVGAVLHISGVVMRMSIMGRPPVSTLYESVIFAAVVSVLMGIAVEFWRRDTYALMSASLIAIVLQFIGFSYAREGDTMGMLEAVLDSNFWLATHVITIIIGYGVSLVAGILGHVLLVRYMLPSAEKQVSADLLKTTRGVALVALFFTTLGTILGGIWADQSWGRFWGWDPKENGALLIVLWLLIAIHGYIAGELKSIGFAAMLSLVNICVAIAWFGVNLLSVGLHSYGFSDKTAYTLYAFCMAELLFVLICGVSAKYRAMQVKRVDTATS